MAVLHLRGDTGEEDFGHEAILLGDPEDEDDQRGEDAERRHLHPRDNRREEPHGRLPVRAVDRAGRRGQGAVHQEVQRHRR